MIGYYPNDTTEHTKFIILPMDYSNMGAGDVKEDIDEQHAELAELARDRKYAEFVIPFAHIDPRRPGAFRRLKSLVEQDGFRGVKIYPTLGYRPDYQVLMNNIYPYMIEKNIPPLLAVLMEDEAIQEKVLFGSDFYAVEKQEYSEKRLSTDLRYALGEEKFWKIANKNPRAYLGIP